MILLQRSIDTYGQPPHIGHAVPIVHHELDDGAHWHEARKIGGSDAAAALGVHAYGKTRRKLYLEETGQSEPFSGNYQTERGQWMEEFGRRQLQEQLYGRAPLIEACPMQWSLRHPKHEWMTANLDVVVMEAVVVCTAIGEIKCPGDHVLGDLDRLEHGEPVAPMSAVGNYVIQCQHNLCVTGLDRCWLVVLPGTREPRFILLERDEALIGQIVEAERSLWLDHIVPGIEPAPAAHDIGDLAKAWRAAHGELEAHDPAIGEMLHELKSLRDARKEIESELNGIKNEENQTKAEIITAARKYGARKLRVSGHSITHVTPRKPRVDVDALRKDHPEIVARYESARDPYFKVT
jgi:putative phage-type endonuclease